MAAAFVLGAEGVQMGTRMVSAAESPVHDNWKQLIVRRSLGRRLKRKDSSVVWGLAAGVGLLTCLGLGLAWTLNLFSFESFIGFS